MNYLLTSVLCLANIQQKHLLKSALNEAEIVMILFYQIHAFRKYSVVCTPFDILLGSTYLAINILLPV